MKTMALVVASPLLMLWAKPEDIHEELVMIRKPQKLEKELPDDYCQDSSWQGQGNCAALTKWS